MTTPKSFRLLGTSSLLAAAALGLVLALPAPPLRSAESEDGVRIRQSLSVGIGSTRGPDAFLRHEDRTVPSLSPKIDLSGDILVSFASASAWRVNLRARTGADPSAEFSLGYRDWALHVGPRFVDFAPLGLPYSRGAVGAALRYEPAAARGETVVELIAARTTTREAETTMVGDDSFGPFFLGHRNIVEGSDEIFIDGQRQRRGSGPGEGDYYIDYRGGFLYFNKAVFRHEQIRAAYQYETDSPGLSSEFTAAAASHRFGVGDGGTRTRVGAFVLRDHLPVDAATILEQAGYTMTAYGADAETVFPSGARLTHGLVVTDLEQIRLASAEARDVFVAPADQFDYRLSRRLVLYQSDTAVLTDKAPGSPPEVLERNLDYVVDYFLGVFTLLVQPPPGATLDVSYRYIDGPTRDATPLQGVQSRHGFDYEGERWRTSTRLDVTGDGYIDPGSRRRPRGKWALTTVNEYVLNETWSLMADLSALEDDVETLFRPALGAAWRRERTSARLYVTGNSLRSGGNEEQVYSVQGRIRWQGRAEVGLEFEQQLGSTVPGRPLSPASYRATAAGSVGTVLYGLTYAHGDTQFPEQFDARLTVPVTGRHARGGLTVASKWMYEGSFAEEPRVLHSLFGNVSYTGPRGQYVHIRATVARAGLARSVTNTYALTLSAGLELGRRVVLDYQLRLDIGENRRPGLTLASRANLEHVITAAIRFSDELSGAVVYRWNPRSRSRPDGTVGASAEQGWQGSLTAVRGAWHASLSYDSTTSHLSPGSGAPLPPGAEGVGEVRRWRLASEWTDDVFTLRVAAEAATFDNRRQRSSVELTPAYRLSGDAELWVGYEYIDSRTALDADASYTAHELKAGVTFRL